MYESLPGYHAKPDNTPFACGINELPARDGPANADKLGFVCSQAVPAPVLEERGVSVEYLRECLRLELDENGNATGRLIWLERPRAHFRREPDQRTWNTRFSGKMAGSPRKDGYHELAVNNTLFLAHRVVFALVHGRWPSPGMHVDHRSGDRSDSRPDNLRETTPGQNSQNYHCGHSDSKQEFPGVRSFGGRHFARIWANGKEISLGGHPTAEAAYAAYLRAKAALHPGWLGPGAEKAA